MNTHILDVIKHNKKIIFGLFCDRKDKLVLETFLITPYIITIVKFDDRITIIYVE